MNPEKDEDPTDSYEVKDQLDTLMRAHKIINDPDKMQHVNKLAGRHKSALEHLTQLKPIEAEKPVRSIQDMRDRANKKFGSPKGK